MNEQITITPKILELNESNDIYMTLKMVILSNQVNYNKAHFTDDYIQGIVDNKDTYIGIPLVANKIKLENGVYDNLTHEFKNGELKTDVIGTFVDFWQEEFEDANCLMGEVRIYKRYANTCEAILELYNSGDLRFSCEVLVSQYESIEEGVRTVNYSGGTNPLIGSCVVTDPAEERSKPTLLIAEAYKKDLENLEESNKEGDELVSETKQQKEELFNKGHEIKYHGIMETASLKFSDVRDQIYNQLNPVNPKTNYRDYNYYIDELYMDYVIVENWDDYTELYKINYTITNDTVILDPKENWIKGYKGFIPEGVIINQLLSDHEQKVTELNNKILELENKIKEDTKMDEKITQLESELSSKNEEITSLNTTIAELNTKINELEEKVTELSETIVSQEETKKGLETQITELNAKVEELTPFKEQVEKAEKEAKIAELSNKYSAILSEETFKSERVQNAIANLDTMELNAVVVEEVAKVKANAVETASKKDEDVVVKAKKSEDLIPQDIVSKYGLSI